LSIRFCCNSKRLRKKTSCDNLSYHIFFFIYQRSSAFFADWNTIRYHSRTKSSWFGWRHVSWFPIQFVSFYGRRFRQ